MYPIGVFDLTLTLTVFVTTVHNWRDVWRDGSGRRKWTGRADGQAQTKIAKQIAKTHDHFILYLSLSFVKISDSEWISIIK